MLAEYRTFVALLAPHALVLRQLSVDARGDANLRLDNGLEVRLGRENAELRLERFVSVALPTLASQLPNVAYVDMRYTNGFAVGFCGSAGGTPATTNARQERRAGAAAMDGSQVCSPPCVAAGLGSSGGSPGTCATINEVRPNG